MIDAERAKGVRITGDMYTYTAAATGLDAAMRATFERSCVTVAHRARPFCTSADPPPAMTRGPATARRFSFGGGPALASREAI
jgi:hypothetical protein